MSDRYLLDVDPRVLAIWDTLHHSTYEHGSRVVAFCHGYVPIDSIPLIQHYLRVGHAMPTKQQWRIRITCNNIQPQQCRHHGGVIKWKPFPPRYWPFVRGIHRSPVNSPRKGQWRGAFMFSLICKRLGKQSLYRWFETPSRSLWRHCYGANRELILWDIFSWPFHS